MASRLHQRRGGLRGWVRASTACVGRRPVHATPAMVASQARPVLCGLDPSLPPSLRAALPVFLPLCLSASLPLSLSLCVCVSVCLPLSLTASLGAVRWSSLHGQAVWCFSTPSLSPRFQAQSVAAADASKHCFLRCCFSLAALAGRLGRKLQLDHQVLLMASNVCASRVQPAADVYEV